MKWETTDRNNTPATTKEKKWWTKIQDDYLLNECKVKIRCHYGHYGNKFNYASFFVQRQMDLVLNCFSRAKREERGWGREGREGR